MVDPFGGVALGAWPALRMGINWLGCELEEKFVDLGNQNIDLWNSRYRGRLPKWGNAALLQGDSRNLAEVLKGAGFAGMISSPPYVETPISGGLDIARVPIGTRYKQGITGVQQQEIGYGSHPAQLGNMREGELGEVLADAVISSPPWLKSGANLGDVADTPGMRQEISGRSHSHNDAYGSAPGQLAAMPAGDAPAACISSPPYAGSIQEGKSGIDWGKQADRETDHSHGYDGEGYGSTPGNLAQLPEGDAPAACISSPPYEGQPIANYDGSMGEKWRETGQTPRQRGTDGKLPAEQYNISNPLQLGNSDSDTFWSAARAIIQQVYDVLAPGGYAVWITKRFVRSKAIVQFSQQWADLCESVGFVTVHWHRAWLVEDRGTQTALIGEDKRLVKKRFSFFRRLHSQKYPHLEIQWEDVICQMKP